MAIAAIYFKFFRISAFRAATLIESDIHRRQAGLQFFTPPHRRIWQAENHFFLTGKTLHA
jgi:hypothetical protein